jgi:hypothetical protein
VRIVRAVQKRKWFQVTRSHSQTPRRHATAQSFATRFAGCRPFGSPPPSFESNGSKLPGSPASFSWLEPVSQSGLSLSRNDCPFPGHHFEVKAPDLLLRHPANRSSCPFGFRFPHALRFAPVRAGSLPQSRCLTPVRHSQPFLGSPLPFGAFRTLKDQSVQPDSWPGSSPSKRSRLPVTPRHRFYFISSDAGSPLQAR